MKRPRQCLPFAVISLNKNDLPLVRSPARPLMFTVTPLTSGKHFKEDAEVRLNLFMNGFIEKILCLCLFMQSMDTSLTPFRVFVFLVKFDVG